MKLYLSGPMTGVKDFNSPAFIHAARQLRERGYEVVSPFELDEQEGHPSSERIDKIIAGVSPEVAGAPTWADLLGRDIKVIVNEDIEAIVLLPGWAHSKGARLEVFTAMLHGLTIYSYESTGSYLMLCYMSKREVLDILTTSFYVKFEGVSNERTVQV